MTGRRPKVRVQVSDVKLIVFSHAQWAKIERAYGHKLSDGIRAHISLATNAMARVTNIEKNAPTIETTIEKIENIRRAARSFVRDYPTVNSKSKDTDIWTSIPDFLGTVYEVMKDYDNNVIQFTLTVDALIHACNFMLSKLRVDVGFKEGRMWEAWVHSLSELMKHHELPHQVRKDALKRPSAFVRLIKGLQDNIPVEYRRHQSLGDSEDRLPQAINRAKKFAGWSALAPDDLLRKYEEPFDLDEWEKRAESFRQKLESDPQWERRGNDFYRRDRIE